MKSDFTITCDFSTAKSKQSLYEALLKCSGKALVTVESIGPQRTMAQNAFYWAVPVQMLAAIFVESGQSDSQAEASEAAHEHLKEKFLIRMKLNPKTGEAVRIAGSSKRLSVSAFIHYIEQCLVYLQTEWGCEIPQDKSYAA